MDKSQRLHTKHGKCLQLLEAKILLKLFTSSFKQNCLKKKKKKRVEQSQNIQSQVIAETFSVSRLHLLLAVQCDTMFL